MIVFWLYFDCIHLLRCILVAALWGIYIVFSWILLYFGGTRRCLCSAWNCTSRSICFWNSSHTSSSSKRWLGGATRGKWGSLCQKKWRKIVTFWDSSTFCYSLNCPFASSDIFCEWMKLFALTASHEEMRRFRFNFISWNTMMINHQVLLPPLQHNNWQSFTVL